MTGQEPRKPTAEGVARAAAKIAALLPPTPLLPVEVDGRTIWCKAECLQPIGAFKIRGAWHRLSDLSEEERARGVVAFSSGNHAQGVAWAAMRLGIDATIVMPSDAPVGKLRDTQALGAKVVIYDRMTEDRAAIAHRLAADRGSTVVPAYDDAWVIEGQGSTAHEAAIQLAAQAGLAFGQLIACCGGGGLASGCALALPQADIVIVEPDGWDDMCVSLRAGEIISVAPNPPPTACDALKTLTVSSLTFDILKSRRAAGVTVSDAQAAQAMRFAFEKMRLVLEPGGAVALAAVLAGKVELGAVPLVTLSGGNVDAEQFAKIISN